MVAEEDWDQDWKQHFTRFVISDRLAVSPPWEAQDGDLVIEPGLAFGTGNHPTTHSCLEAIAKWAVPENLVLILDVEPEFGSRCGKTWNGCSRS